MLFLYNYINAQVELRNKLNVFFNTNEGKSKPNGKTLNKITGSN